MTDSIIPKGMRTFLTLILLMGCILILPLSAQESKPPERIQAPSTGVAGQMPTEGIQPGIQTPPVQLSDEQLIREAFNMVISKKLPPAAVSTPPNFNIRDYPNDSGGSFIIEWLFTSAEESAQTAREAAAKPDAEAKAARNAATKADAEAQEARDAVSKADTEAKAKQANDKAAKAEEKAKQANDKAAKAEADAKEPDEKAAKANEFINYKYRVYHSAGKYNIQLVVTSNPDLNKKNLLAVVNKINSQAKLQDIIKKYDISLTILKNESKEEKRINADNLNNLVDLINSKVDAHYKILKGRRNMYLRQVKAYKEGEILPVYSTDNDALKDILNGIANVKVEDSPIITNIGALKMGSVYLVFSTDEENIVKSLSGPEFSFVIVDMRIPIVDASDGLEANYVDLNPMENTLTKLKTKFFTNPFWSKQNDDKIQAYQWAVPEAPVLDRSGQPRFNPSTNQRITNPDIFKKHYFQLAIVQYDQAGKEVVAETRIGAPEGYVSRTNFFNFLRTNNIIGSILYCAIVLWFINHAKKGKQLFIRKIAGLDAVDEAVGRATEMGRPILYMTGLDTISTIATIAAVNILGQVAKKVANYESQILNPHTDPVVMSVCQEVVKDAYTEAGRPDAYNPDNIFYITSDQFSYVAAIDGIMVREKPATNIFMGTYYAESLILAETGASTGAIQIAGTDALAQLPFFITTCDYTLIGEELYAASAYLAREPKLLGSLKGQDFGKLFLMIMLVIGVILMTIAGRNQALLTNLDIVNQLFQAQ